MHPMKNVGSKKFVIAALALFLIPNFGEGAPPAARKVSSVAECPATEWPYARNQDAAANRRIFQTSDRADLIEYLFFELTSARPNVKFTHDLLAFLEAGEDVSELQGFFELVREGSGIRNAKSVAKPLPTDALCKLWKLTQEAARGAGK